jgi:hypothetical protein
LLLVEALAARSVKKKKKKNRILNKHHNKRDQLNVMVMNIFSGARLCARS